MHLTREQAPTKLPILRKGSKYVARASSNINNSVPVVIAVRDMLNLAKDAKEVRKMIYKKLLKINGKPVKEYRQSIQLFNIFQADKSYELSISPTKKFIFLAVKEKDIRLCKVVNKRILRGNVIQINLHDGTNVSSKEKIQVGDSVYIDFQGKIKKIISLKDSKKGFVILGKYAGNEAHMQYSSDGKVKIKLNDMSAVIKADSVVAI